MADYIQSQMTLPSGDVVKFKDNVSGYWEEKKDSLEDQEFLYRESLVDYDGKGIITRIKGNTLKWNQIKGTPTELNVVTAGTTVTENADGSLTVTGTATGTHYVQYRSTEHPDFHFKGGHKYFYRYTGVSQYVQGDIYGYPGGGVQYWVGSLAHDDYGTFIPHSDDTSLSCIRIRVVNGFTGTATVNFFVCDLTLMGLGDLTSDEFVSLFPLINYAFTPQPRLISFGDYGKVSFNQLIQNGNFADTSIWDRNSGATFSVSNNVVTITPSTNNYSGIRQNIASLIKGHKYIGTVSLQTNGSETWRFGLAQSVSPYAYLAYADSSNVTTWQNLSFVWTCDESQDIRFTLYKLTANGSAISAKNTMLTDLTQMFGAGNEPTIEEFEQLYPNDYYDYTTGREEVIDRLAIKTVGKNKWKLTLNDIVSANTTGVWNGNSYTLNGITFTVNTDDYLTNIVVNGTASANTDLVLPKSELEENTNYILSGCPNGGSGSTYRLSFYFGGSTVSSYGGDTNFTYLPSVENIRGYIRIFNGRTVSNLEFLPMIRLASVSDNTFEPYTESTLSLPVYTYFPTGMKDSSVTYEVADELTNSKATTRVGIVDLGSLPWTKITTERYEAYLSGIKYPGKNNILSNIICSEYETKTYGDVSSGNVDNAICVFSTNSYVQIRDTTKYSSMTAEQFASAMSGVMFYYELETPTSQDISLDLTYPIWNGGTEQILPVNSATPITSPIIADIDYGNIPSITEELIDTLDSTKMDLLSSHTSGDILVTDSSGQAVDSGIQISYPNAGFHNSIYRGKNIQSYFDDGSLYKRINGTDGYNLFEDLFIGDYFDITMPATSLSSAQTVRCLLAHFDYYLRSGDTETNFHHAVIVPFNSFVNTAQIYDSNINTSGYNGSVMHQTTLPIYKEALATIFGSHLKSFRDLLSTAGVTSGTSMAGAGFSGYASSWEWQTVYLRLMSELMVYGTTVFSSSFYDVGVAKTQLALFRLAPERIVARNGGVDTSSRDTWWLSAVASGANFASVGYDGNVSYDSASYSCGVRPLWLIS